ncbi:STAS domain-containing protein [Dactylosporangium aurantiacum]|uniref:STAS domain-containing protein n=1 Tax=Dactylosporangium aurantiacum TaxID=35754 RepID=A0A9Q9I8D8_9ACTN|nr:STAS domain-containing protein [Dactylosporangium aurantiacum]MDG6110485.1 STAS domain-containing protein [Dactylosporangium aurantiacum]UWZ51031.1 STAS domain-containing protein [Dactylosporangium aurantiacum]
MSAVLSLDGTDFSLACDECGHLIPNLAGTMRDWNVAWSLFTQDGWHGAPRAVGPHACGRCVVSPRPSGTIGQTLYSSVGRLRRTDAARRVTLQVLSDVTVVHLKGGLGLLDNTALHDLLEAEPSPGRHLLFELSLLPVVDSATLEILVQARDRTLANDRRTCVVSASGSVVRALRLLCLDQVLPNFVDQIAALDWLRCHGAGGLSHPAD